MTTTKQELKNLLEELYETQELMLQDQIDFFKKNSKDNEDEDYLGYLISIKRRIIDVLKDEKPKMYDKEPLGFNTKIDHISFDGQNKRIINALKNNGIYTLNDLVNIDEQDIYKIPNLGNDSVKNIIPVRNYGIKLTNNHKNKLALVN